MDQKYPGFCKMCFLKVTGKGKIKWHQRFREIYIGNC